MRSTGQHGSKLRIARSTSMPAELLRVVGFSSSGVFTTASSYGRAAPIDQSVTRSTSTASRSDSSRRRRDRGRDVRQVASSAPRTRRRGARPSSDFKRRAGLRVAILHRSIAASQLFMAIIGSSDAVGARAIALEASRRRVVPFELHIGQRALGRALSANDRRLDERILGLSAPTAVPQARVAAGLHAEAIPPRRGSQCISLSSSAFRRGFVILFTDGRATAACQRGPWRALLLSVARPPFVVGVLDELFVPMLRYVGRGHRVPSTIAPASSNDDRPTRPRSHNWRVGIRQIEDAGVDHVRASAATLVFRVRA